MHIGRGPTYAFSLQVVERAQQEDLQQSQKYLVSFMHNSRGQVVIDRRFNTSQLVSLYLDKPVPEDVITWNPDNPNQLRMALPGANATCVVASLMNGSVCVVLSASPGAAHVDSQHTS